MKIEFEIEMPTMPDFLRFKKEASLKQDGFKIDNGYAIENLSRAEAEEFADNWKLEFIKHWERKVLIK